MVVEWGGKGGGEFYTVNAVGEIRVVGALEFDYTKPLKRSFLSIYG